MHYQKSDKTRRKIIQQFYDLAGIAPTSTLPTVGEICGALDISRSTFYCHFSGINEIIETESDRFIQENLDLQKEIGINDSSGIMMNRDQIRTIILSAQRNRKEAMFLFRSDINSKCYQYILESIMDNMNSMLSQVKQPMRSYMCRYLSEGILSSVHQWVVRQDITVDNLVDMLYSFTIGSIERAKAQFS